MSSTSPPLEAQRFGRSQTPESPRPVHIPEPANIPVLLNQMDPVFNDTATYNISDNQTFSPFPDPTSEQVAQSSGVDEHDAVQNFFREAEHQAAAEPEPIVNDVQSALSANPNIPIEANPFPSVPLLENTGSQEDHDAKIAATNTITTTTTDQLPKTTSSESNTVGNGIRTEGGLPFTNKTEENLDTVVNQPQQSGLTISAGSTNPEGGVDYQSLLDTISQSASTAPAANSLTALTTAASDIEEVNRALPSVPGLPPKPPPQEHPVEFPSYSSYENDTTNPLNTGIITKELSDGISHNGVDGQQTGLPEQVNTQTTAPQLYNPLPNFDAYNQIAGATAAQLPIIHEQLAPGQDTKAYDPLERPWSPKTQQSYDRFLEDERRYVTEGIWDKFPMGSRLFVGNLPSEKVTKRDLFHKFHRHGQLAQISIKQAYGFVQFLEASSCLAALNAEQGIEIRGRKVHLEVSKPQKNTRNTGGGGGSSSKNQQRRRSRSPERTTRRENRNHSDFRDEPGRKRDEFRNRRSPSPRGYRQRDEYRSNGRNGRSRSPFYGNNFASPTSNVDDETSLQLPRREPRQVPDVQLLILEPEVVQSFINWVEQGFRNKGLQAATIWVNNRLPLAAVIKRQIIEGVQAVVKLSRVTQNNSKIPLQVFDRSAGASNVTYNEYVDLDVSVAADVVIQARMKERSGQAAQNVRPQTFPPQGYQPPAQYGSPQLPALYPQQSPPQYPPLQPGQIPQYPYASAPQTSYRPPTHPQTPTGQAPNLQQLLANLRQPPNQTTPQNIASPQNNQSPNLSGYFNNVGASQQFLQGQPTTYGHYTPGIPQQGAQQPNVQNIMEQLARYQR